MKKIYFIEYEKVPINILKKKLSKNYINLTKDLNIEKKRQRLIKYYLISLILEKEYKITIDDINYNEASFSNSYYKDNLFINISNKNNILAISISDFQIGIDLEQLKQRPFLKIIKRYFTQNILHNFLKINDDTKKLYYFYKIWTCSESFLKMQGKTLYYKEIDKHIEFPYTNTFFTQINNLDYIFSISSKDFQKEECVFLKLNKSLKLTLKKINYKKI